MSGVRLMSFADTPERETWRTELARLEDDLKHLDAALIQAQASGASRRTLALRRENWRVRHRLAQLREFLGLPVPADESPEPTRAYARLGAYLAARPPGETRVMLEFGQVEALLASPLPSAARQKRRLTQSTWWRGNARQAYAWRGWLQVGWHVEAVDRVAETVTFARTGGVEAGDDYDPHAAARSTFGPSQVGNMGQDSATDAVNTPAFPPARMRIVRRARTRKSGGRRGEESGE